MVSRSGEGENADYPVRSQRDLLRDHRVWLLRHLESRSTRRVDCKPHPIADDSSCWAGRSLAALSFDANGTVALLVVVARLQRSGGSPTQYGTARFEVFCQPESATVGATRHEPSRVSHLWYGHDDQLERPYL